MFKDFGEIFDDFINLKKFISIKQENIWRYHKLTSSKLNIHLKIMYSCLDCPFYLNYICSNEIYKPKKIHLKLEHV